MQETLPPAKANRLQKFAKKVKDGLELAKQGFTLRKVIVDYLDVKVKLIRESGNPFAYATYFLSDVDLELSTTLHSDNQWNGRQLTVSTMVLD